MVMSSGTKTCGDMVSGSGVVSASGSGSAGTVIVSVANEVIPER